MGAWLCDECLSQVRRVLPPLCQRCGTTLPRSTSKLCSRCRSTPLQIERIRSVAYSEGPLRTAIHPFKYEGVIALAVPLAQLMADYWSGRPMPADVAVPVPLHRERLRWRGFNRAAYLADELSQLIGLLVDKDILVRHRRTAAQVDLDADQRRVNVRDAFRCVDSAVAGKRVLLIDDVCTTGSTLEACEIALRRGGAREVRALTLARAH